MPILKHWWCPWGRNLFRFFRDRWWGIRRNVTDPQLKLFHNVTTLFVKLKYYTMLVQERKKKKNPKNTTTPTPLSPPKKKAGKPSHHFRGYVFCSHAIRHNNTLKKEFVLALQISGCLFLSLHCYCQNTCQETHQPKLDWYRQITIVKW